MNLNLGMLDVIGRQLEANKDRLGPLYRPLYVLSGALAFVLLFALIIGFPLWVFDDFQNVVSVQVFLVLAYFMLQLTLAKGVFDRFVFAIVLYVVASAAPVLINGQLYLDVLTAATPGFFAEQAGGFPETRFFLYGVRRGIGNTAWALPFLLYFFTFYPRFKTVAARRKALVLSLWTGLAAQVSASLLLGWAKSLLNRYRAPVDVSNSILKEQLEHDQALFFFTSLGYLALGFVSLGVLAVMARRKPVDRRVLVVVVLGLVAGQVLYGVSGRFGRRLHQTYPGARASSELVKAYRSVDTGKVVFTTAFLQQISPALERWQPYADCHEPESHRFTWRIVSKEDFQERYRRVDIRALQKPRQSSGQRPGLSELFCQPEEETGSSNADP